MNVLKFQSLKKSAKKITMVTCYDYWSARILAQSEVDCILVGDSLAMVMHGHETTIPATIEVMTLHTQAVTKAAGNKFIVADMPFLATRKGLERTMWAIEELIQKGGAHAVKIEGGRANVDLVRHIVDSGVPVMGHLGLTIQFFHQQGGFRVQGRDEEQAELLVKEAKALEEAGCFALVLECIPQDVAERVTNGLSIPTIGIGAGSKTDGQVLVLQDLLGVYEDAPKLAKKYLNGFDMIKNAINEYCQEVRGVVFPSQEHTY